MIDGAKHTQARALCAHLYINMRGVRMFVKIDKDSIICWHDAHSNGEKEVLDSSFSVNLFMVNTINVSKCSTNIILTNRIVELKHKIAFDVLTDDGMINLFTLYFVNKKTKAFKKIKKAIKHNILLTNKNKRKIK